MSEHHSPLPPKSNRWPPQKKHGNKCRGGLKPSKGRRRVFLKPGDISIFYSKCLTLDRILCRLCVKTTPLQKKTTRLLNISTHGYFYNLPLYIYLSFFKLLKKKEIYREAGRKGAKTRPHHFCPLVTFCSTTFSGFPPVFVGFVWEWLSILINGLSRKKDKTHHSTGQIAPGPFLL